MEVENTAHLRETLMPSCRHIVLLDGEYFESYTHPDPAYRRAKEVARAFPGSTVDCVPAWWRPDKDPLRDLFPTTV